MIILALLRSGQKLPNFNVKKRQRVEEKARKIHCAFQAHFSSYTLHNMEFGKLCQEAINIDALFCTNFATKGL